MRIEGEWLLCDDAVVRPTVTVHVQIQDGRRESDRFLVDSGTDRTVVSADLLHRLHVSGRSHALGVGLFGIGGAAAFTDPESTNRSIPGQDVLDNFDPILSWRRDEVLLLAPNHQYHVVDGGVVHKVS
jgi:hypothetical protein